jgi:hypothetical protein
MSQCDGVPSDGTILKFKLNNIVQNQKTLTVEKENVINQAYIIIVIIDCLCGLVVRVLGYRSRGPGSIPGTTRKKK